MWNAQIGVGINARVELVRWESHSVPELGTPPQKVINSQLVEDCDFGIAIFWSRIGTPTEDYDSGSLEEVNRLIDNRRNVMIYFSEQAIPQNALKDDQFIRLQQARKRFEKLGLIGTYTSIENLRETVHLHLTSFIHKILKLPIELDTSKSFVTRNSRLPDIRVIARSAIAGIPGIGNTSVLAVEVQNHSSGKIYLDNIFLELKDGGSLLAPRDFLNGDFQKRRELESGESFTFHFSPEQIMVNAEASNITCAAVRDAIDRVYRSDALRFSSVLNAVIKAAKQLRVK